jgi:hypothetical protein
MNIKGDSGMTDSKFMAAQKTFQDKHREEMKSISRLSEPAKPKEKQSWFSRLKYILGIK